MKTHRNKILFALFYSTVIAGIILMSSCIYILSTSYISRPLSSDSATNAVNCSDRKWRQRTLIWKAPAENTEFPPMESFTLSKEMVKKVAKDNVIVVSYCNYALMDLMMNWVQHLNDVGVYNIIIGGLDRKVVEDLYWKGVPVFEMARSLNLTTEDVGWGSAGFGKIARQRVSVLNVLLTYGYEILMCDTDVVWLKNPLPYFARFPEADVLASSDALSPSVTDDRLEVWYQGIGTYNSGLLFWRHSESSRKLAKEWMNYQLADVNLNLNQPGFNKIITKKIGPSVEGGDGLVYAYDGSLKLGILPVSLFCSGHTYFVQGMAEQLKLQPYAFHATFQYGGTPGKRHRMREAMHFFDPPQYYDVPGGFLSFKLTVPKSLFVEGLHSVENHFSLVNYQLKQIRTAFAIASLLNRTLVMPPIWCRLDKFWYKHPGVIPNTLTKQPFICPMDHIFQINRMVADLSEEEFGPRIDFREYSFLKNPSLPKMVKESIIDVRICEGNSTNCNKNKTSQIGMPKNLTDLMITELLSSYKDTKVIEFSSMDLNFYGFSDNKKEEKFRKRVKTYTNVWCCLPQSVGKSQIYYDIYWDEKPGWKPMPSK